MEARCQSSGRRPEAGSLMPSSLSISFWSIAFFGRSGRRVAGLAAAGSLFALPPLLLLLW